MAQRKENTKQKNSVAASARSWWHWAAAWEQQYKTNGQSNGRHHSLVIQSTDRIVVFWNWVCYFAEVEEIKMTSQSVSNICKIAALLCIVQAAYAGVVDNSVFAERGHINSGNELVSTILNNCYNMDCLKTNVLSYLNTILGVEDLSARSLGSVDDQIFDRVAKYLKTNEIRVELPETFFRKSEITFRADRGFDVKVSEEAATEGTIDCICSALKRMSFRIDLIPWLIPIFFFTARKHKDDDIKKKLLLPALLLLKLKLKAILPIFVGIIGIKAVKALIISKLALSLVVGFIAYNMFKKPAAPAAPVETSTASTYDPSSWEPSATSGGPYARIWDPSAQNLAYSYYSGSSGSSGSGSSSVSATSKPSSYSTI